MALSDNTTSLQSILDTVNTLPAKPITNIRYQKVGTTISVPVDYNTVGMFASQMLYSCPSEYNGLLLSSVLWVDLSLQPNGSTVFLPFDNIDNAANLISFTKFSNGQPILLAEWSFTYMEDVGVQLELSSFMVNGHDLMSQGPNIPMALISIRSL